MSSCSWGAVRNSHPWGLCGRYVGPNVTLTRSGWNCGEREGCRDPLFLCTPHFRVRGCVPVFGGPASSGQARLQRDLPGSHEYLLVGQDWANLRRTVVGQGLLCPSGSCAALQRSRLAQSAPVGALSGALVVSKALHWLPKTLIASACDADLFAGSNCVIIPLVGIRLGDSSAEGFSAVLFDRCCLRRNVPCHILGYQSC